MFKKYIFELRDRLSIYFYNILQLYLFKYQQSRCLYLASKLWLDLKTFQKVVCMVVGLYQLFTINKPLNFRQRNLFMVKQEFSYF